MPIDKRIDTQRDLSLVAIRRVHYFAIDTINKIFDHIDRLKIGRCAESTGALKSSIRSTVHTNAGGNEALVQFFYMYYGDCVEQAVGKYRGIDKDLGDGVGVKSKNIKAPQIEGVGYGPMTATFDGVSDSPGRVRTHKPRPFLRSEIRRQVERTSYKLMEEAGLLIDIHMATLIGDEMGSEIANLIKSSFASQFGTSVEYDDKMVKDPLLGKVKISQSL